MASSGCAGAFSANALLGTRWRTSNRPPGSSIRPSIVRSSIGPIFSISISRTSITPRQSSAPDSPQAEQSVLELDETIERLAEGFAEAYADLGPDALEAVELEW